MVAMRERANRYDKNYIEKLSQEMPWLTATQLGDQAVPLAVERFWARRFAYVAFGPGRTFSGLWTKIGVCGVECAFADRSTEITVLQIDASFHSTKSIH